MGQDDSCGICGRHYQSCRHAVKEHLKREPRAATTLCGRRADRVLVGSQDIWREAGVSPDDKCLRCHRTFLKTGGYVGSPYEDFDSGKDGDTCELMS